MMDGKLSSLPMVAVTITVLMFLVSGSLPYYHLFSLTSAGSLGVSSSESVTTSIDHESASATGTVDLTDSNPSDESTSAYDPISEASTAVIETGVGSSDASAVGSPDGTLGDYSVQIGTTGSTAAGQGGQGTNSNNSTDDGSGISRGASTDTDGSGTGGSDGLQPNNVDTDNQNPQLSSSESSGEGSEGVGTGSSLSSGSSNSTSSSTAEGTSTSGTASNQTSSSPASSSPATSNQSSSSETVSESSRTGTGIGDAIDAEESVSESTDNSAESVVSEQDFQVTSATNPNSVEYTISAGDGQNVNIGSISNTENVTATISLDKSSYNLGDSPIVTVNDGEANIDPNALNTIQIIVTSSSDPHGILLTLTETGPNTGVFDGPFSFTSDVSSPTDGTIKIGTGDQLGIQYVGTHPRLQVEINGVQQGGSVSLTQVPRPEVENPPYLLGPAVEISYGPEVQLIPNGAFDGGCPEGLCEGTMNLEMSYANSPLCIDTICQIPEALTIWQYIPDLGWFDLRDFQPPGTTLEVDTNAKIVSAFSPFKGGIFSLGISNAGGVGGGGGGLALPGAGVVLDLIAPVVEDQEPTPPSGETPTGTSLATDNEDSPVGDAPSSASDSSDNSTSGQSQSTGTGGIDVSPIAQASSLGSSKDAISLNTTILVPGIGNVTLSSSNLDLERNFEVTALKDQDLSDLKIIKSSNGHSMTVATQNGTKYDVVGPVLNIGPTDLDINGTLTISIPYDSTQIPNGGGGKIIRLIYYSGSSWEDVTVEPFANGKIVTGSLADIGPVAAATMSK